MWLVNVKKYGKTPSRLPNRMKKNSVKTNGKYLRPSSPMVSTHIFITVSYDISAADCSRPGTIARGRMPNHSSPSTSAPATTIIKLAWVKFTDAPMGPSAGCS